MASDYLDACSVMSNLPKLTLRPSAMANGLDSGELDDEGDDDGA